MLALVNEANKTVNFAVKTLNGITEISTVHNKIMQGDVLSPLVSSNMVDVNITKTAISTENIYMFKNKVPIPPLIMQDDTLAISTCGYKTRKITNFLNTHTNILSHQFGRDKCVKMHIGKKHNIEICGDVSVYAWSEKLMTSSAQTEQLQGIYFGKENMKNVTEKKYLGDLISCDLKNNQNIKKIGGKETGNVNKIILTLSEKPYGKHLFKAEKLMKEGLLINSLLTNSESWVNVLEKDVENLGKCDTVLLRKILSENGNPSKVFMFLEHGIVPVKFIMKGKQANFLKYMLNENMGSMLKEVYEALKSDSRKGDFVYQVTQDLKDLKISRSEETTRNCSKSQWKKVVKRQVKSEALDYLIKENNKKEKTRDIVFESLNMSSYLYQNRSTPLSKVIFSVTSQTLDI